MPDPMHGDHSDILRRLDTVERRLEGLRYVDPTLLSAHLETVKEAIGGIRADIIALEQADSSRRTQVYGVIGAIVVALVVALIQSGVLSP